MTLATSVSSFGCDDSGQPLVVAVTSPGWFYWRAACRLSLSRQNPDRTVGRQGQDHRGSTLGDEGNLREGITGFDAGEYQLGGYDIGLQGLAVTVGQGAAVIDQAVTMRFPWTRAESLEQPETPEQRQLNDLVNDATRLNEEAAAYLASLKSAVTSRKGS